MVKLNNVSKEYKGQLVIKNFSYQFPDNGLVLLFGESGCGKTTLLNMIAGIIAPSNGEINLDVGLCGYITQDSHFIDYLTVLDNLRVSVDEKEESLLEEKLKTFDLWEQRNQYPGTLSGGQRQRLAILQMVLLKRKLLLLDEPTAALDPVNKKMIFDMLRELKKDHLIIFSSHDKMALEYADSVIDFHDLPSNNMNKEEGETKNIKNKVEVPNNRRKLQPFMKKYYSYPNREKKSSYVLFIVLVMTFLCVGLIDLPQNKIESNIQYIYKLNQLTLVDETMNPETPDTLLNKTHAMEADLIYHLSVSGGNEGKDGGVSNATYNMTAKTLPFKAEAFNLSDRIAYGGYYTEPEQVILSYEAANQLGNPEELVGKTIKVELYDQAYDMKIAGVFDEFNKFEKEYIRGCQAYENENEDGIYLNGEFTKRYLKDSTFSILGKRTYILYFKDYYTAKENYSKLLGEGYNVRPVEAWIDNSITLVFGAMFNILLPLVIIIVVTSILLYFQTNKIEMSYQKHIFSTYNYLGYSLKEIRRCWIKTCLQKIMKLTFVAAVTAGILMLVFNVLNQKMVLVPFQIFSVNPVLLGGVILALGIVTVAASYKTVYDLKIQGYYEILLQERDLF